MNATRTRPQFLTTMAVLFTALAISNLTKVWQVANNPTGGIVVFGIRFRETLPTALLGGGLALVLLAYAFGVWKMRRWVLRIAIPWAFWVPLNLVLFWDYQVEPPRFGLVGFLGYLFLALGGSIGTALYLTYHQDLLSSERAG